MAINVHWFLPTPDDIRNVVPGLGGHGRPASLEYLSQIARAAEAYSVGENVLPLIRGAQSRRDRHEESGVVSATDASLLAHHEASAAASPRALAV
jgi:hypothetical protein